MPYIETSKVAEMRKAIRKALPDFKISVTKHHHSSVNVNIMSGPIPAVDINEFHYKRHLADSPVTVEVIDTIVKCIFDVQTPKELVNDGDYGSVPTFYYNIRFGKWDKDYVMTEPTAEHEARERRVIQKEFDQIRRDLDEAAEVQKLAEAIV